ncbi:MAG: hypothetical protein QOF76_2098, partial [Solirubrobacteraceae bacterium]|nr:hypothetical protein [Solirubrobacteraceae bacterium]
TTVARFGLAAPVLAVFARRHLREAASPVVAAWGAAGFGGVIMLQNAGIARTSVTHAAVILGAVPILTALAAAAAGHGPTPPRAWLGFVAALIGIALVAGTGGAASTSGDLLMFASAVLSAALIVAQTQLLEGRDPVAVTAVQMAAAAVAVLPVALVAGTPPAGLPTAGLSVALVALVTVGSLLPFTLYAWGQTQVSAQVAGAFVNLETLVGAVLGALAFGDPVGTLTVTGAIAIVLGIALSAGSSDTGPVL